MRQLNFGLVSALAAKGAVIDKILRNKGRRK